MKKQLISIILPFRNEVKELEITLQSFVEQDYTPKEVILMDNDSTDGSTEVAKKFAKKYKWMRYFNTSNIPGKWATHYYIEAMKHAKGEIIYMADANGKLLPHYLALTAPLINEKVAGVVGKVIIWPSNHWISKFRDVIWTLRYNDHARIQREINEGRILPRTFSRAAYNKVGGFNPDAGWAVDTFFNKELLKQGYKIVYEPRAMWWHKWREELKVLWEYSYKFGRLNKDIILVDKKQWVKVGYFLLPWIILLGGIFDKRLFWLLILHPFPLLINLFKSFIRAKGQKNRRYVWYGLIISYTQNIPYALGFIKGVLE